MHENSYCFKPAQIILHIPHSSTYIPEEYRTLFFLNKGQLQKELLRMTDLYTDELFDIPGIPDRNRIVFPYSRLICDVERFRDDSLESMAERGMGACYRVTSDLKPLKQVPPGHRDEMLTLYDRHHAALTRAANRVLENCRYGIIIDCHSFASGRLPYEGTEKTVAGRPDICIGTDWYHTPDWLEKLICERFGRLGYTVGLNTPFGGTLVPMKYYHSESRLFSIMIEINRRLYMDEETGLKKESFGAVRKNIIGGVRTL